MKIQTLGIMLLTVLFIGTTAFTTPHTQGGKKYKSETCKVQMTFPGEWSETSNPGADKTTYTAEHEDGKIIYQLNTTIHDVSLSSIDQYELAEVSLEAFVDAVEGELLQQNDWNYKGNRGLKASIKMTEQGYLMQYRIMIVGQHQYQLIVMSPESDYDEKTAEKFMNSFKLL